MSTYIFRWNGQQLGFIDNGSLFDAKSNYLGWVEGDGSVWAKNGKYIGEIVEGAYILRRSFKLDPLPKLPRSPPLSPFPPIPPIRRIPRIPQVGWDDPFDE